MNENELARNIYKLVIMIVTTLVLMLCVITLKQPSSGSAILLIIGCIVDITFILLKGRIKDYELHDNTH